ncbi:hypothetical protein B0A55_02631 [Friedmanniomyces simplex]|uniref:Uncharacterized protein n=1 Tax=Friedmanniomyces simplex TaxID=329884 RepID=A0A4V5NI11_9PEZI|nr:hypothetical protein B0A55_02631 [Friedmanniomyces simplex]
MLVSNLPDIDALIIEEAIRSFLNDRFSRVAEDQSSDTTTEEIAETEEMNSANGAPVEPSQGIKGLLYFIAEEDSKRKAYEHRGISCEECGESPIRGVRYHCLNCPDFDLCATCEIVTAHQKTHVMAKIKIPLPVLSQPCEQHPVWYPGDPRNLHFPLDAGAKKRLASLYEFEEPTIDAFYDQFTCIANVPWSDDPMKTNAAIDRRAFNKALMPERWHERHRPNAIYDRMFAFYDTNGDGLIGFEEFLSGIAYLRGPKRLASLRRALEGLDIDGDGFVDRSDFLRLFRAKYLLQQQLISDMVDSSEQEQTVVAMETLRSSQPISSAFNQEEIPQGESRPQRGKQRSPYGDMLPLRGAQTILEDHEPWLRDERPGLGHGAGSIPDGRERLRRHLSRFDELLYESPEAMLSSPAQHAPSQDGAAEPIAPPDEQYNYIVAQPEASGSGTAREALLQAVEGGLNHMLDRMFEAKERMHQETISSREERNKWRAEIDEMVREQRAFEEDLRSAANVDPLLAVALESHNAVNIQRKVGQAPAPTFRAQLVPTDAHSLAEREAMIAEQPLEELLQAAGYKAVDKAGEERPESKHTLAGELGEPFQPEEQAGLALLTSDSSRESADPTMPQNKPSTLPAARSEGSATDFPAREEFDGACSPSSSSPKNPPSKRRLEQLAAMDEIDQEIEDRGGPSRLTLDEIEGIVNTDTTKQMRGLVVSWLEWASF